MFLKVCGITRLTDAQHAAIAAPPRSGFVFWPRSPRYVDAGARRARSSRSCRRRVTTVGVFVNESVDSDSGDRGRATGIDAVQLHGDEPPSYADALGWPVFRSMTLDSAADDAATRGRADTHAAARRGRSGAARWHRARRSTGRAPPRWRAQRRVVLAGGLTPENVGDAIATVRPFGVDVSSGVEESPGVKDFDKMTQFLTNARAAFEKAVNDQWTTTERPVFGRRDPDARGYFGAYGGRFVPETLVAPIEELTAGYLAARADAAFRAELDRLLTHYVGRPTPLYESDARLARSRRARRDVRIFLKREDLDAHRRAQDQQRARPGAARASGWARRASSPRPAPGSTAWRPPPRARCSASSATSTWAPRTCGARR